VMVVAGDVTATAYQRTQVQEAQVSLEQADAAFAHQVSAAVAEGTSPDLLAGLVEKEHGLRESSAVQPRYFADRSALAGVQSRAQQIEQLSGQVRATEVQLEVQNNTALVAALQKLSGDLSQGNDAGVDLSPYTGAIQKWADALGALAPPSEGAAMVAAANDLDGKLVDATTARVAQNQAAAAAQAAADAAKAAADAAVAALASAKAAAAAALVRADAALAAAQAIPVLDVTSAAGAIAQLSAQLATAAGTGDFLAVGSGLRAQAAALENLLAVRTAAFQLIDAARAVLAQDVQLKLTETAQSQALDAASQALPQAATLDAITAIRNQVQGVKNDLDNQYFQATVLAAAKGKLILVSLKLQELKAIQDGVVLLDTVVATGRPALPTLTGTFHVFAKYSPYRMVSPWPYGSAYYYPPVWMSWAMEWEASGYFIHDAPWRTVYGPGANLISGTHGCINVPHNAMSWLYQWTPVGTTVTVIPGAF
jgi:lipoprotein-anchoring transpeptidase ErfK/SrfK